MSLLKLDIYNVRNIQKESIAPSPAINFIYGENASGKSALLEAIFILGRAKSFRSTVIKPIINFAHDHLIVSAQLLQSNGSHLHLGIQLDGKTLNCRTDYSSEKL
jgi:DNA replication and repair protein RecF